ncbi:MAG: DUF4330 domain-containing protein [Candidatus Melainabacteria bacterium]
MKQALIDMQGRLLGRWNVIDFSMLAILFLVALGVVAVQSQWHVTSGEVVKGESDIEYSFFIYNAKTLRPDLFQVGKQLSMTIRNQPRGNVTITAVKMTPKQAIIHGIGPAGFKVIDDPADPYGYNYLVTVRDHAKVTEDGYVVEGIKVKSGMKITVEGFDYQFSANIVSVKEAGPATAGS